MRLGSDDSSEERLLWKVVRLDSYKDLPGTINSADEATGECEMMIADEAKIFNLGAHGIRIVRRSRH
jgi:hypothetical protein